MHGAEASIKAANKLWYNIHSQIPCLGLSKRLKWRVFKAAVEARLLYGSETRPVNSTEMIKYQRLMNRAVRGICLKAGYGIREIEG